MRKYVSVTLVVAMALLIMVAVPRGVSASDAHKVRPDDCIQKAIDDAEAGDTVYLEDGRHELNEDIHITKRIRLTGHEDAEVDMGEHSFRVEASGITCTGLHLKGTGAAILVDEGGHTELTIEDNSFSGHSEVLRFRPGYGDISELILKANTMDEITHKVVEMYGAGPFENVTIAGNNMSLEFDDGWTAALHLGELDGEVAVTGNTITIDSTADAASDKGAWGIFFATVQHTEDIVVSDNTVTGADAGLYTYNEHLTIEDNKFADNLVQFLDPSSHYEIDDLLSGNEFDRSAHVVEGVDEVFEWDVGGNAIFSSIQDAVNAADEGETVEVGPGTYEENVTVETDGLHIVSTEIYERGPHTIVRAATVDNDAGGTGVFTIHADGVWLEGFTLTEGRNGIVVHGDDNWIAYNTIVEQHEYNGISVRGNANTVARNVITDNPVRGILVWEDADGTVIMSNCVRRNGLVSDNNHDTAGGIVVGENAGITDVYYNCIADNAFGLRNDSAEKVEAIHNWWGEIGEPSVGEDVTDNVDYDPWLADLFYDGDTEFTESPAEFIAVVEDSNGDGVGGVTVDFYLQKLNDNDDEKVHVGSAETSDEGLAKMSLRGYTTGDYALTLKAAGCMEATETIELAYEMYTLTIDKEGEGSVRVDGDWVDLPYEEEIPAGTSVELRARSASHWSFDEWEVNGETYDERSIDIVMDHDIEATAHFSERDVPDELVGDILVDVRPPSINMASRGVFMVSIEMEDRARFPRLDYDVILENGDLQVEALRVQNAAFRLIAHFDREDLNGLEPGKHEVDVWVVVDGDEEIHGQTVLHLFGSRPPVPGDDDGEDTRIPPGLRDDHPGRGVGPPR